jgi:hypothetical protein
LPMMSMSDVFVGGLVVAKGKTADFHGLPAGAPRPVSGNGNPETFPAVSAKSTLKLGIVLNALFGWAISGNLSHSKELNLTQIDALFYGSDGTAPALADPNTQKDVKDLVESQHLKVYQVKAISTTKAIKFTTSGSLGASVSVSGGNGTDAKATDCKTDTPSGQGNAPQNNTSQPAGDKPKQNFMQAATGSPSPSGSLQLCTSSDHSLTLATSTDMVFAVKLYEVTLDPNTHTYVAGAIPVHAGNGAWFDLINRPPSELREGDVRKNPGGAVGLSSRWEKSKTVNN